MFEHDEMVMGTVVSFTVYPAAGKEAAARLAVADACAGLHRADAIFSTWVPQSPLSRLRRGEDPIGGLPQEIDEVLELCREAKAASAGWFDPWAMPGGVDPTGLVKGWAVERALQVLREAGVRGAIVNGGGDIAATGSNELGEGWRVGIRHPWRADALACIVALEAAVATSGTYERGQHLIDPRDGVARVRAVSATVTGPSLAFADAFATALAVGGRDALDAVSANDGYGCYLVLPDATELSAGPITFIPP
ncbi:MAG: FAD:protein FMN transferase [Mycobacteriales bacterium]